MINLELSFENMREESGPYRSYEVTTRGNSMHELLENAWVFEIDQDGGERLDYNLQKASNWLQKVAEDAILKEYSAQLMKGIR